MTPPPLTPPTPEDHAKLYGELRAAILSHHFAFSRFFRANHVALWNVLGSRHKRGSSTPAEKDDPAIGCGESVVQNPGTYADAAGLASNPAVWDVERWRVDAHLRENPLEFGSQLMLALSIEHSLGIPGALPILQLAIDAIGSLYKFPIGHMAGYIIRWDPVTSDDWATADNNGRPDPLYCCEFPLDGNRQYLYCTPFNHPDYVPFDPAEFFAESTEQPGSWRTYRNNDDWPPRVASRNRFRSWEPSMDELVGLVATYAIVHELVSEPSLRLQIRRQVSNLGDYLAEHGYILVRPCGGFAARGASGGLPALEYPFDRIFRRITGTSYRSRASFEEAMAKAGVWGALEQAFAVGSVVGTGGGAAIGSLLGSLLGLALGPVTRGLSTLFAAALGASAGWIIGRAAALWTHLDCFDVWAADQRQEFVLAYLLKALPISPQACFELWMRGIQLGAGMHARGFPPFLGLASLFDDPSSAVRAEFLAQRPAAAQDKRGVRLNTGLAMATAVSLGARAEEAGLRDWLDATHHAFVKRGRDLALVDRDGLVRETVRDGGGGETGNDPMDALEYLACLALSWRHVRSERERGRPAGDIPLFALPPGAGVPGGPAAWPTPRVPAAAVAAGLVPALTTQAVDMTHLPRGGVDLFPPADATPPSSANKTPDPPPKLPPVVTTEQHRVVAREHDGIVEPGIIVRALDSVRISVSGTIWAGVWLAGRNGPDGWANLDSNPKLPLPGGHPYALLYRLVRAGQDAGTVRWRHLGRSVSFTHSGADARLQLRSNDDRPGNGNGQFDCDIRVDRSQP